MYVACTSRERTEEHRDVELVLVVDASSQEDEVDGIEDGAAERPERAEGDAGLDHLLGDAHQHHAPDADSDTPYSHRTCN